MPSLLDVILRRNTEEKTPPECPDHHVEMRLRGKQGRPSRFEGMSQEDYTQIYFCPVEGCNVTAERKVARRQIPVPGMQPARPEFARVDAIEKRLADRRTRRLETAETGREHRFPPRFACLCRAAPDNRYGNLSNPAFRCSRPGSGRCSPPPCAR
jgi:hypothetical protein